MIIFEDLYIPKLPIKFSNCSLKDNLSNTFPLSTVYLFEYKSEYNLYPILNNSLIDIIEGFPTYGGYCTCRENYYFLPKDNLTILTTNLEIEGVSFLTRKYLFEKSLSIIKFHAIRIKNL